MEIFLISDKKIKILLIIHSTDIIFLEKESFNLHKNINQSTYMEEEKNGHYSKLQILK